MTTALSLVSTLRALLPSPHLKESLKALLRPLPLPQPLPLAYLIRTTRKAMERALLAQIAHRRRGPRPRLLVVIDLVTRPKRGPFPALPLSFFYSTWGLHLVVLYLVYGPLRLPWAYRVWRGKGEKTLSLLALRLLHTLPPWIPRRFRLRVVADSAFGTLTFLYGLHRLGYEGVVGMRRNRRLSDGQKLAEVRQGERVFLRGLSLPVWVVR